MAACSDAEIVAFASFFGLLDEPVGADAEPPARVAPEDDALARAAPATAAAGAPAARAAATTPAPQPALLHDEREVLLDKDPNTFVPSPPRPRAPPAPCAAPAAPPFSAASAAALVDVLRGAAQDGDNAALQQTLPALVAPPVLPPAVAAARAAAAEHRARLHAQFEQSHARVEQALAAYEAAKAYYAAGEAAYMAAQTEQLPDADRLEAHSVALKNQVSACCDDASNLFYYDHWMHEEAVSAGPPSYAAAVYANFLWSKNELYFMRKRKNKVEKVDERTQMKIDKFFADRDAYVADLSTPASRPLKRVLPRYLEIYAPSDGESDSDSEVDFFSGARAVEIDAPVARKRERPPPQQQQKSRSGKRKAIRAAAADDAGGSPARAAGRWACANCRCTETPQKRKDPKGDYTLCNACGVCLKRTGEMRKV